LLTVAQQFKPNDFIIILKIRRAQIKDPIRPTWHLSIAEGFGMPFDPNGAIFKGGVYDKGGFGYQQ
jgi:sucrose-6-phosphate hydrolase SacC (GH32 family)